LVLEKVISIREAIKRPWTIFLFGGIISVICFFISFLVFQSSVGMFAIFLITIAMMPFMVNLVRYAEAKEEELIKRRKNLNLYQRHREILIVYIAFFAGMILALSILFLMLPQPIVQKLFADQINEINLIRGRATLPATFLTIVVNNLGVLFLSFLFSFLFGAGAVFILAWNASVLAAAIGMAAGGLKGLPFAVLAFFPHGSLEILAYFIGAIAGGLISVAITRRKSEWASYIFRDCSKLIFISVILLIIAGMVETLAILL
jgi:uncharacterized membrane protein SpoIIM required for sporulation